MAVAALGITATQMAVATTAISVAAAVQQTAQARANAKAQEQAAELRNEALVEQTVANYDELADVELDAQQRAIDDSLSVQKGYIQQKGNVNVMAAAMGTGGMSVQSQLEDLEREKYSNYNTVLLSKQAEMDNIRSQAESIRYQAANNMDVRPVSRPSYAAAALNIGATALSGYSNYRSASQQSQLNKPVGSSMSSGG